MVPDYVVVCADALFVQCSGKSVCTDDDFHIGRGLFSVVNVELLAQGSPLYLKLHEFDSRIFRDRGKSLK